MKLVATIVNSIVTGIVAVDEADLVASLQSGGVVLPYGSPVQIGWGYDGTLFTAPILTLAQKQEIVWGAIKAFRDFKKFNGAVLTCGMGVYGQLGNGSTANISTPYVALSNGIKDLAVLGVGTCYAITTTNTIYGWGANGTYGMANGGTANVLSPTIILATLGGLLSTSSGIMFLNTQMATPLNYYHRIYFGAPGNSRFVVAGYGDAAGNICGTGTITNIPNGDTGFLPNGEWFTQIGFLDMNNAGKKVHVGTTNKNNLYAWGYGAGSAGLQEGGTRNAITPTLIEHPSLQYNR